ncbi:sensor histidine kinase [bacterium]|nr:sensor histidine kinase [bacterium]
MAKVPFNVDAYTARLIGRENVSKLDGAVIELIKNTYDADATICVLYFDAVSNALYLMDNGMGMTLDVITKHWMTIGRSSKKSDYITESGRIQTGAKGIGRFALDRIAEQCTMLTGIQDGERKILWKVDWSEFIGEVNITEINADIDEIDISFGEFISECTNKEVVKLIHDKWGKHGTIFKLTCLHEQWNQKLIRNMKENLSSLIPYELNEIYKIYCFDNESSIKDAEVLSNIDSFSFDYKIEFDVRNKDNAQDVVYKIWRDEFVFGEKENDILKEADLLAEKKYFHGAPIVKECQFSDIVGDVNESEVNSLGSFSGVLYFSKLQTTKRDRERFYQKDVSGRIDIRDTFGGIKIYRDSFRVRPYGDPKSSAFDWLQLARRKTGSQAGVGSGGIWRVSAEQMMGSIFISRMNISLPDQSNREGIVETKEFRLLKEFIEKMISLLEQDRQSVCRKLNTYYEKTHPTENIEKEIREKAEKKKETEKNVVKPARAESMDSDLRVDAGAAQLVIDKKDEEIQELENEIKMLRALATTGIVTNTYIHEFKTLSHKLNMKIVMAKEAIDQYHDIDEAAEYINQANDVREAFNSWFQVTIESVKNDKRKRRKVDIGKVISGLTDSWNQTLANKRINIQYMNLSNDEIVLKCFPYEIETIINNLVTNSVASFDSIITNEREIIVTIFEDEEYVWIEYSDTGAGLVDIYKKNPERILEAFETSKRDADGELVGTGMGMWIVNNTVQDYKGKIDLSKNIETKDGFYATISLKK